MLAAHKKSSDEIDRPTTGCANQGGSEGPGRTRSNFSGSGAKVGGKIAAGGKALPDISSQQDLLGGGKVHPTTGWGGGGKNGKGAPRCRVQKD